MNKITIVFSLLSLVSFNSLSYHSDEHNNKIRQDVLNPGWDFEAKTGEKVFNKVRVCSGPLILDTFQATFSNSAIF